MYKQRVYTIIVALIVAAFAAVVITSYISAANYGNRMEMQLKAKWEDNENVLAQYGQKIMEMAQIPEMYAADVKSVTTAAIQGRYGEKGSNAVMQWIKEQNPTIDSSVYVKIQQAIEAGRNEFKNSQTQLLEIKRSYETSLGTVWQGFWLARAGYPKVDLTKYNIITTDRASKAFQTGKEDGPLQLRK
jgi:flagellar biosynthesis component FlhA